MESMTAMLSAFERAQSASEVREIVRGSARALTEADGLTFVLREGDKCLYAEEDAIAPLWKGRRFPLETCISGWVMLRGQIALIPDIYADERIPHDAYRATFVKSLLMVPVPQQTPVAAIGVYWARGHTATWAEQHLVQTIANAAGAALLRLESAPSESPSVDLALSGA